MLKYSIFITVCTFFALWLSACSATPQTSGPSTSTSVKLSEPSGAGSGSAAAPSYQKITQDAAKARMDSGEPLVVLDVRTAEEFSGGHIPRALNLPLDSIGRNAAKTLPDKDAEILVYCRSGNRSKSAAKQLIELGYSRVFDFGGITSWTYGTE